jgi:STE24 endopeptidase
VMAHELGHQVHNDIPKLIAVESVTTFVGLFVVSVALHWAVTTFGFQSVADVAALPVLALTLGIVSAVLMPLTNGFSRLVERQADCYALESTRQPNAFIGAMTRLTNQNLAELRPARWAVILFYDHPPIGERLEMARQYARTHHC